MIDNQKNIDLKLYQYKVKFIKKKLLEGAVIFIGTVLLVYLTITSLEAIGRFGSLIRASLLFLFIGSSCSILFLHIIKPILQLLRSSVAIEDEEAAMKIGSYFPKLGDKLLNYIQLSSQAFTNNALAKASLDQRASNLADYTFTEAVSFNTEKRKLLHYILPLVVLLVGLIIFFPSGFIGSSERILHFNKAYIPQAPFRFELTDNLVAFRNENYLLQISLQGDALPNEAYFVSNGRKIKMVAAGLGLFELRFPNISSSKSFVIEAAFYNSKEFVLNVVDRPSLSRFEVNLNYPAYLRMADESFQNIGSFEVPEGTTANWTINTRFTNQVKVYFAEDSLNLQPLKEQSFTFKKKIIQNQPYRMQLNNAYGMQQGIIKYEVKVIKDRAPEIDVKILTDTLLYNYVVLAGNLADDHGLSRLQLHYTKNSSVKGSINLDVDGGATSQSFFYQWLLDSLKLIAGDKIQFYLQVTDNDAINNFKSTKSKQFYLNIPGKEEAKEKLEKSRNNAKEQITDTAEEAKELKENIDKLVEQLKGKKELSWQEEQLIENLIEQKEKLTEEIKKLQEENKVLSEQQEKFESPSSEIQEKQEQLQELLDELMDEETKQLYEELKKLLESFENTESVKDLLKKIQNKELNLEQELVRALEFFKQLQYEQKLEESSEVLDKVIEEQEELIEKTKDKSNANDSLAKNQEQLNEKFQEFQEKHRDAKELNQDLKRPNSMEDTSGEEEEVNDEQKQSKENLENNNRNKSKQSQQNASKKMQQISNKIKRTQSSMQMQQMQEDLAGLQAILNNLIELSFDQEKLMVEFKAINQSDPSFITLSQEQLSLKEDSKIINDSLIALATRVMAISSFVTRELNEMNQHMDASIEAIRERNKSNASVSQQLTMTSVNNLALMLDNVMQQMQENMGGGQGEDGQENNPALSELQKQLNEQIRELSQSGKSGRELSEELAKLAAEQERIRKALEEAAKKYGGDKGELEQVMKQMEDTEIDLVNKKLIRQTIERQQQVLSRMLKAEKAMRERELDSKREAKSATQYEKALPKAFADYIKQREKEIELLKTVPPRLVPFFKIESGEYFERLKIKTDSINH